MTKLRYQVASTLLSVLGGVLAGAIFKRVWKLAAGEDEAPKARATPSEAGAKSCSPPPCKAPSFALVKAVIDRGTAEGARKFTGTWPGDGE